MNHNYYKNKSKRDNPEIDTPLEYDEKISISNETTILPSKQVDNFEEELEKKAQIFDKMDKHLYKQHGFHLLIGCGIAYLVLVIFDVIVSNAFSWKQSELMNGFVELLKFVISTLIGYVFSETQKHKNE